MISIKKKLIISALVLTIAGIGIFKSTQAFAQDTNNNPFSTLVQKIADKFQLKKEDVQAVFDQDRTERKAQMETKRAERQAEGEKKYLAQLDQWVKDGKITEAQKTLILNKHKELQSNRPSELQNMQGKTEEEKKAAMEAKKTEMATKRKELEDWAKQNDIDLQYLFGAGMGQFGGMKGGRWNMK